MFDQLFRDAPSGTFVEITRLPDSRKYIPTTPAALNDVQDSVLGEVDVYFGPALRKTLGSTKEDVYGTRVLWVDVDRPQLPLTTFQPSLTVHSGGGWHLYWLLRAYVTDTAAIEDANKALAEDTNADHCWNANRLLRVPGTRNSKYGADTRCELRQSVGTIYDVEDFQCLRRLDGATRHKIRTGDRRGYGNAKTGKDDSRSGRDWAVIKALVIVGASDQLITTIFATQQVGDKVRDPDTPRIYLRHTIESVRAELQAHPQPQGGRSEISEGEDGYYVDRTKGRQRLSTFLFNPKLLLQSVDPVNGKQGEDVLVGDMIASDKLWSDVSLPRSAFNDRHGMDRYLTTASWSWLGRDDDVRALLPFLLRKLQDIGMPHTQATAVLGRHGQYFVGTHQTLSVDKVYTGNASPLAYHALNRETPRLAFADDAEPDISMLPKINSPAVVWNALGWFMATPYKPALNELNYRFPILNVFGTRGSGKTTMIKTFQRMLGYENPSTYDCNTTRFVVLTLLGCANAVPVAFSEYRQATASNFIRFVLLSYDTGHDPRGRSDQTTIDYPLIAPFSVDGEDIVSDAACKERMIAVGMHPETIAEGTPRYEAFNELRDQPLESFAMPYLQFTLRADVEAMLKQAKTDVHAAFPEPLPDRVRNNMIVVRFGQISFELHTGMHTPANVRELFEPILFTVWSPELGRGATLVDDFATGVVNAVASKKADFFYRVKSSETDTVVWFQLATTFDWWLKFRRMQGQVSLDRDAIRTQLLERSLDVPGKGQYALAPGAIDGTWCYGVSLSAMKKSGLDIPDKLDGKSITVTF